MMHPNEKHWSVKILSIIADEKIEEKKKVIIEKAFQL